MRLLFKIAFNIETISEIKNNKLHLPKSLFDFLPNEENLLTVSLPDKPSTIYSLITGNTLLLNQDSKYFFESLSSDSIVFGSLRIKNKNGNINYEMKFSKLDDFSDVNITEKPLVSKDLITKLKQVVF